MIAIHPGIQISFDSIGVIQWFVIIPLEAIIAFPPERGRFDLRVRCIIAAALLAALSLIAGGFGAGALPPFFAGLISFTLTYLLFHHPRWAKPAVLEPFFFAWVVLRLLAFSRSGEDIAGQAMALTQFILVWAGVVFCFTALWCTFASIRKVQAERQKKERCFLPGRSPCLRRCFLSFRRILSVIKLLKTCVRSGCLKE
uniref:Uncharacterized protein n=1 Tax=uncultured bacterium contig00059 TaxID=1181542 RepID=A0A0A6ZH36_9BACT|nr:hypothetical protein [uncultured bacterium contig00059]